MVKKRKGNSNNNNSNNQDVGGKLATAAASSTTETGLPVADLLLNHDDSKQRKTSNKHKKQHECVVETLVEGAVHVVRNFFSAAECRAWIGFVEDSSVSSSSSSSNKKKKLEYVNHPATRFIANRECFRWQCNDWNMSQQLFDRLVERNIINRLDFSGGEQHVGGGVHDMKRQPVTCNGNLRFYKYEKGMKFGRHVDGSNDTERGPTEVTVLIYLSNCGGGATRFHLPHRKGFVDFAPEEGAILFHVHGDKCLDHEATAVTSKDKYVLRTDLVYPKL